METYEVTVTASSVNLRKTPGGEYMCKVPKGTALTVLNEQNGFGQVIYGRENGWIELKYTSSKAAGTGTGSGVDGAALLAELKTLVEKYGG